MGKLKEGTPFPIVRHKNHETIISETEWICDIFSSTQSLTQTAYQVAAWNANIFENLSILSAPYEYYRFLELEFYFQPNVTEFMSGTGLQTGYVAMCFVDDPLDTTLFSDKIQMLNADSSVSSKCSAPLHLVVDCSKRSHVIDQYLYNFRTLTQFQNTDVRLLSFGILDIGVGQCQSTGYMLGSIYTKYKVSCRKLVPVASGVGQSIASSFFSSYYFNTYVNLTPGLLWGLNPNPSGGTPQLGNITPLTFLYFGASENPIGQNAPCSVCVFPDSMVGYFSVCVSCYTPNTGNYGWGTYSGPFSNGSQTGLVSTKYYYNTPLDWNVQTVDYFNLTIYFQISTPGSYEITGNIKNANGFYIDYANGSFPFYNSSNSSTFVLNTIPADSF